MASDINSPLKANDVTPTDVSMMAKAEVDNRGTESKRKYIGRKRASRACLACRARKVRCDVENNDFGVPCTNCKLDAQECIVPRRYRKHRARADSLLQGESLNDHELIAAIQEDFEDQVQVQDQPIDPAIQHQPVFEHENSTAYQHQVEENRSISYPSEVSTGRLHPDDDQFLQSGDVGMANTETSASESPDFTFTNPPENLEHQRQRSSKSYVIYSYYPFIEAESISRIPPEDVQFLEQLECFRIPSRSILDKLMREYFLHVHPHLPLFDEGEFWKIYRSNTSPTSSSRMSLFVIQAMLLVACSFLSTSALQELGFQSARAARATYYRRAKALFDLDTHRSRMSSAQGAVLLTTHVVANDPQVNTYWLGIAIYFAKAAGADRFYSLTNIAQRERSQLKRIWWSCIIRDRVLALGVRRPLHIYHTGFDKNLPVLTEDDFRDELAHSEVHSRHMKQQLFQSLSELCDLAVVLTDVINTLYPPESSSGPLDANQSEQRLQECIASLNQWSGQASPTDEHTDSFTYMDGPAVFYNNLNLVYYYSAKAALCNHQIVLSVVEDTEDEDQDAKRVQAKKDLGAALTGIATSLNKIIDRGMVNYLPISIVAYATLPLIWRAIDSRMPARNTKAGANPDRGQDFYLRIQKALQTRYEGTDKVLENIGKLVNNLIPRELPIRGLPTEPGPSQNPGLSDSIRGEHGKDIVVGQPYSYLRVIYTLDFFLSRGRFPEEHEFADTLQMLRQKSSKSRQNSTSTETPLSRPFEFEHSKQIDIRSTVGGSQLHQDHNFHSFPPGGRSLEDLLQWADEERLAAELGTFSAHMTLSPGFRYADMVHFDDFLLDADPSPVPMDTTTDTPDG